MTGDSLSHLDSEGKLQMVDVSAKEPTRRTARARCIVVTSIDLHAVDATPDGLNVIQVARLAGIHGAKITAILVPLCHPIGLDLIQVDVSPHAQGVLVHSAVSTVARTGVEMEALAACALCAINLLDSVIERDPTARIADLVVSTKTGGASDWGHDITAAVSSTPRHPPADDDGHWSHH